MFIYMLRGTDGGRVERGESLPEQGQGVRFRASH